MDTNDDPGDDQARLELALAGLTDDVKAQHMTAAEVDAERSSGRVTLRGLLAGMYFAGAPGRA